MLVSLIVTGADSARLVLYVGVGLRAPAQYIFNQHIGGFGRIKLIYLFMTRDYAFIPEGYAAKEKKIHCRPPMSRTDLRSRASQRVPHVVQAGLLRWRWGDLVKTR